MNNHQIKIKNISLKFPHKTCFEDFSTIVYEGSKIGIIGRNGSGKSTLLKMILGMIDFEGDIELNGLTVAYVPQIISDHNSLSGGQRFNKSLSKSLSKRPDILLLDEPTNHLDSHNRNSLMRMLERYRGTLIIATHDVELLRNSIDILWHIDNGEIRVSHGNYDDYMCELGIKRESIEDKISALSHHKREAHKGLMREQKRAKSSKAQGEKNITNRKWPTLVSHAKVRRAQETSGKKKLAIRDKREDLIDQLSNIRIAEIITPKFSLSSSEIGRGNIVQINNGQIGYEDIIASDINFALAGNERVAILGKNGSGKTTLVKAMLKESIRKKGEWIIPNKDSIGYLDQHYATLNPEESVKESVKNLLPSWSSEEIRKHLNDFLFRKNEEVDAKIKMLSGGEKSRLCLAHISAKTPRLLILDEVTNNLDIETKEHVIQVLKHYPGAMIVISHDKDFLERVGIESRFSLYAIQ